MFEQFTNGIMPIIVQAVISILGILITFAVAEFSKYLVAKKQTLIDNMGVEKYRFYQYIAESVYYAVEQEFRNFSGSEKKIEFDKRLLIKIPGLSQEDLDHFREYVVGKIKGLATTLVEKPCLPPIIDLSKDPSYLESPEKITVTRVKRKGLSKVDNEG